MKEDVVRMVFALIGVSFLIVLVRLDKEYPEGNPINNRTYWIIGGYVIFVFAGPRAVRNSLEIVIKGLANKFTGNKDGGVKDN